MFDGNTTLEEMINLAKEFNAGLIKVALRDNKDEILVVVAVSADPESAQEVYDVLEKLENSWDEPKTNEAKY